MGQKVVTLKLSELDVEIVLKALGDKQNRLEQAREPSKAVRIVIERIYRALGVRL
jgi:hypothetical protein